MLSLEAVSAQINQKNLFVNFSLSFLPHGIFQIIGPNASGKTSFLEIISSLCKPSSGKVLVNQEDIYNDLFAYRDALSYIGHKAGLMLNATVQENLEFYAKIYAHEMLIPAAIKYFSLENILERRCRTLSAGQKKLVQLAKLLLKPTEIWLLDEPFANLDSDNKEKLIKLITIRARDGGIIIFTSHEQITLPKVNIINLNDFKSA